MADKTVRKGSLQFWPRKRARKILPSVNWIPIRKQAEKDEKKGLLGFIGYKVGMVSLNVKDNTPNSSTKGKVISMPGTILECPPLKIYSVRLYKDDKVRDIVVGFDDKLKSKLKKPKSFKKIEGDFDYLNIIVYPDVKGKAVYLSELGISGSKEEQLQFVNNKIGKQILASEVLSGLVDVRGVTKGKGLQGPVRRFGISLKDHKSEKGRRRPGSLAPWHPARVTFRAPQAGQTGFQTRIAYNKFIMKTGSGDFENGFHHYGKITSEYVIVKGSIPGTKKRALLLTSPIMPSKKQIKQNYDIINII
ncbi:MAG: 50S ribosomal protein L3 [Candidatus Nanoarchaeia archaeon]